jgi:uncharacterized RDD family membrane protein YckC
MDAELVSAGLRRRLAAFVYEGILLFGVVFFAAFAFSVATGQRHGLQGRHALAAFLFLVIGAYFVGFWTRGGQTLALKTWQLRVTDTRGQAPSLAQALLRYVLSWLWFLPALLSIWLLDLHGLGAIATTCLTGMLVYALLARLHPQRRLPHEVLSGTQTVYQPR